MRFKGSVYTKTHCLLVKKESTGPMALTTPGSQMPVRLEALRLITASATSPDTAMSACTGR